MLFKSVRVTLGRLKGRREFSGKGRAVITEGELAGTAIEPDQVTGRALVMGQVTIILGSSYFKSECPLAVIRQGLTMYKVPVPGSKSHKLTARPGDRMYGQLHDTERELGTPNLRPWVLHGEVFQAILARIFPSGWLNTMRRVYIPLSVP